MKYMKSDTGKLALVDVAVSFCLVFSRGDVLSLQEGEQRPERKGSQGTDVTALLSSRSAFDIVSANASQEHRKAPVAYTVGASCSAAALSQPMSTAREKMNFAGRAVEEALPCP